MGSCAAPKRDSGVYPVCCAIAVKSRADIDAAGPDIAASGPF
jgi:hypothetical protein